MFLLIDEEGERRNICNVSFLLLLPYPTKTGWEFPRLQTDGHQKGKEHSKRRRRLFFYSLRVSKLFFLGSFVSRRRRNMNATKSDGPYKFGLQQRKRSRELSIRLVTYSTARLKY